MRAYLLGSALAWLRDYRLDGLRLDAVHALRDTRALHFLEELSTAVDALAAELGRPLFLIAESDLNDPRTITPRAAGGLGLHAQWNDDFHHALHTALTGESQGYYADFAARPARRARQDADRAASSTTARTPAFRGPPPRPPAGPRADAGAPAARLHADPRPDRQPRPGDRLSGRSPPGCWPARPR